MTNLREYTGDYVLDTTRTRMGFVARHTMGTRVHGWFDEFEGCAYLDGEDPSNSRVQVTILTRSIQTGNRRRDEQLRTRFLDQDNHPTITFASTSVERTGDAAFAVTGDLTIRGVTRPVGLDLVLTGSAGFHGGVTIDRMDWGVNWNAATRALVGRTVTLELDVAVASLVEDLV